MASEELKAARIILEDGTEFEGFSFGYDGSVAGEVVFYTGGAGMNLVFSDPACRGSILVMAYPSAGNGGVPGADTDEFSLERYFESPVPQIAGLVVLDYCDTPSHYLSKKTLGRWLKKNHVPAVCGIDTRALVCRLRDKGFMRGKILVSGTKDVSFSSLQNARSAASAGTKKIVTYGNGAYRIVLIDCGVRNSVIRSFLRRGATVIRVPRSADYEKELNGNYDAVVAAGGPGDPTSDDAAIAHLRESLKGKRPVFGIGQGGVLLALASGAETFRMPAGHRGQNIPCLDLDNGRCYITSQNHGYGIRDNTLPGMWEIRYINNNDQLIEGIYTKDRLFTAVLFQPEGSPGPHDTDFLYDEFMETVAAARRTL